MLAPFGNSEPQGTSQDRRTGIYVKRETRKARRLGDLCLSVVYLGRLLGEGDLEWGAVLYVGKSQD